MSAPVADPFAFGGDDATPATAAQQPCPTPEQIAAAISAERRRRLIASVHRAADLIDGADVLLLHTGAGWSADSGLPIYRDVANLPAMQARGLTYRDICNPAWLDTNPQLFIGFWGHCFNQYRDSAPHEGYDAVRRWREERFHERTEVARRIEHEMERLRRDRQRRRREKGLGRQEEEDEEDVEMLRDKGIVHPPEEDEEERKEDEQEQKVQSTRTQAAVQAEVERVHITSLFTLREGDEVRYSALVDSNSAQLSVASANADGSGDAVAQSLSLQLETTAIHTPSHSSSAAPVLDTPSATAAPSVDGAPTTHASPLPPGWVRGDNDFVRSVQQRHEPTAQCEEDEDADEQHERPPAAGAFFALTSNVDGHFHRAGFDAHELYELHGSSETWQCSQLCSFDTWTPPPHFRFAINQDSLLAPYVTPPPLSSIHISAESDDDDAEPPAAHAGASSAYWTPSASFATNVPRCPLGHLARPSVLMFNDANWLRPEAAEQRYLRWMHAMLDVAERDSSLSVVVLEVGCGLNVPTVRWRSESVWQLVRQRQQQREGQGKLGRRGFVRVNLNESRIDVEGKDEDCVSVELGGLMFTRLIDGLLEKKRRGRRQKRKAEDDVGMSADETQQSV